MKELRGRIVLLDFWTSGCINCQHVLPDLAAIEDRYAGRPLTVIGVHTAKVPAEEQPDHLRHAVLRHGITHPVVLDQGARIWDSYGIKSWPTLVLIDPYGYVLGAVSGEGHRTQLETAIDQALAASALSRVQPVYNFDQSFDSGWVDTTALRYPGKVLADPSGNRLFIADSGHHRIVVTDLDGVLQDVIGSGTAGAADGPFETASFRGPQGLALDGDLLYLADTENHLIRLLDLRARVVHTIAGSGMQATSRVGAGLALETPLNSPWDLALAPGSLTIAMAGSHQIWRLDLETAFVAEFVGSGVEGRIDGSADQAAFAQPSGLCSDGTIIWVADSESSCVRELTGNSEPRVRTVAGGDLFLFGDRDGTGDAVRLQHPLGICLAAGLLYLADTYNHRIKQIDPATGNVQSLFGDGVAGYADGPRPRFRAPSGLSLAGDRVFVADTDNHCIRVVRLDTGVVHTLELPGLCPPGVCVLSPKPNFT